MSSDCTNEEPNKSLELTAWTERQSFGAVRKGSYRLSDSGRQLNSMLDGS